MSSRVLVLDFGSQYNQLIVRRVRELGVYAELKSAETSLEEIQAFGAQAIILSGGPSSVSDSDAPRPVRGLFDSGLPILGICYGLQVMVDELGGVVVPAEHREYGHALLEEKVVDSPLVQDLTLKGEQVWMSHGDRVDRLPEGFHQVASTHGAPFCIIENSDRRCYGLQFHPEVNHTPKGSKILSHFLFEIAGCRPDWQMKDYLEQTRQKILEQVGDQEVILGLSGGVDSSVMAALLGKILGHQVTCIFIDNGLLRLNERQYVEDCFKSHFDLNLVTVDAEQDFLDALKGIEDPEEKRKAIGATFIRCFEKQIENRPQVKWLAQGTIYPDVIESTSTKGKSQTIKSHHNVGGLPERMHLKVLEPLRDLFKDEVRELGRSLGLPAEMVERHPFPGPGLGVRILGEVKKEYCDILRQADAIYLDEIRKAGIYNDISQAFAVLLPVRSVGVMGDGRTYENVLALRAVTTTDFMTADWYRFPHDLLAKISNRIVGEVRGVNRVVYDVSSKPPATIEWE